MVWLRFLAYYFRRYCSYKDYTNPKKSLLKLDLEVRAHRLSLSSWATRWVKTESSVFIFRVNFTRFWWIFHSSIFTWDFVWHFRNFWEQLSLDISSKGRFKGLHILWNRKDSNLRKKVSTCLLKRKPNGNPICIEAIYLTLIIE